MLAPVEPSNLHQRLRAAAADRSYRELGELTNTHPETVRRYMHGGAPSVEFLSVFANALGVSVDWLLTGAGAMRSKDLKPHVLREASVTELLNAMAQTIERLIMRVERLEAYMQTLETRIRANTDGDSLDSRNGQPALMGSSIARAEGSTGAASPDERARSIADALPQRARPDAGGTAPAGGT